ncbi:MAG TPA: YbaK/EbsC family protein [Candidatus Sulfopaludibacter sp.]|jgi:Ala-tRNA(Pro) deacylase|nr:YbaK/EbsC family protein [Candidatus Sulfopaludibacter sp.]
MPHQQNLRSVLEANHLAFTETTHPAAFTAREVASAEHLAPREVAKTVVLFGDGEYHMIVVPANKLVDFQEVRLALGLTHVRLATEEELGEIFRDCEVGAMPPVGNMYDLPVYLDSGLAAEPEIVFNAGTHHAAIHMKTADYRKLVNPIIIPLSRAETMRHGW